MLHDLPAPAMVLCQSVPPRDMYQGISFLLDRKRKNVLSSIDLSTIFMPYYSKSHEWCKPQIRACRGNATSDNFTNASKYVLRVYQGLFSQYINSER